MRPPLPSAVDVHRGTATVSVAAVAGGEPSPCRRRSPLSLQASHYPHLGRPCAVGPGRQPRRGDRWLAVGETHGFGAPRPFPPRRWRVGRLSPRWGSGHWGVGSRGCRPWLSTSRPLRGLNDITGALAGRRAPRSAIQARGHVGHG